MIDSNPTCRVQHADIEAIAINNMLSPQDEREAVNDTNTCPF